MASNVAGTTDAERVRVWDSPLRLFHWLLVAAIAVAFLSSEEDSLLSNWHVLAGWTATILIAFRLVWGVVGGEHARFASFVRPRDIGPHVRELLRGRPEPTLGHNALGAVSVILLLLLVAAVVSTGIGIGEGTSEELHETLAWSLLALIGLHIIAVVLMSFLSGDNLVRAMIDGTKARARHPGASDARSAAPWTFVLGLAIVIASAAAITAYDPAAFSLRSADSYEHRGEDRGHAEQAELSLQE